MNGANAAIDPNNPFADLIPPPMTLAPAPLVQDGGGRVVDPNSPFADIIPPPIKMGTPETGPPLTWERAKGIFGTAIADAYAGLAGQGAAAEAAQQGPAYATFAAANPQLGPDPYAIAAPTAGAVKEGLANEFGRTEYDPRSLPESLIHGAGVGTAMAPIALASGGAASLPAAGVSLASDLASGIGSDVGQWGLRQFGLDPEQHPLLGALASLVGGTAGGVTPAVAAKAGQVVKPIVMPQRSAQSAAERLLSEGGPANFDPALASVPPVTTSDIAGIGNPNVSADPVLRAGARTQYSENLAGQLDAAAGVDKAAENALWNKPGVKETPISGIGLAQNFNAWKAGLSEPNLETLKTLEGSYEAVINRLGDKYPDGQMPLGEIQDLRKNILRAQRSTTDGNKRALLGDLDTALFRGAGDNENAISPEYMQIDPDKGADWNAAIQATSNYHGTWGGNTPLGKAMVQPDAKVLDTLFAGGPDQGRRVEAFVDAVSPYEGRTVPVTDPRTGQPQLDAGGQAVTQVLSPLQTARDAFTHDLVNASNQGSKELENFVTNNAGLIGSSLLSDDQRAVITAMRRQAAAGEVTQAATPPLGGPAQLQTKLSGIMRPGSSFPTSLFSPEQQQGGLLMGRAAAAEDLLGANGPAALGVPRGSRAALGAVLGGGLAATPILREVPWDRVFEYLALAGGLGGGAGLGHASRNWGYGRAESALGNLLARARTDPAYAASLATRPAPTAPSGLAWGTGTGTLSGLLGGGAAAPPY